MAKTELQRHIGTLPLAFDDLVSSTAARLGDAAAVAGSASDAVASRAGELGSRLDDVVGAARKPRRSSIHPLLPIAAAVAALVGLVLMGRSIAAARRRAAAPSGTIGQSMAGHGRAASGNRDHAALA